MASPEETRSVRTGLLDRVVAARPGETGPMVWAAAYFFCLLCGYYILRPLRDEMGIQGGVRNLPWLNLATLATIIVAHPLYSGLVSRLRPSRFVPIVYRVFALNLLIFFVVFHLVPSAPGVVAGAPVLLARVFYVWVSVFNLFAVTIFWGFLVDIFRSGEGKRLFGFVGAGGTLGAIAGSSITSALAVPLGAANLLLGSILFLELAVRCARRLSGWRSEPGGGGLPAARAARAQPAAGGRGDDDGQGIGRRSAAGLVEGIGLVARSPYLLGICLFMLLYTITSQFLYFQKAAIVATHFSDSMVRVTFFANLDRWVNLLTLTVQIFLTGRLVPWMGVALALALTPVVTATGFIALGLAPTLGVIVLFEVTRKASNYAIARPAREILYTVTERRVKYKAKSFIETFVYRGGDGLGSLAYGLLRSLDVALATLAWAAVPLALLWMGCGLWLGRRHGRLVVTGK